jgi:hypothetical protein
MTFGLQVEEKTSHEILDRAQEMKLSFLDTADAYPLGGTRETIGETETISLLPPSVLLQLTNGPTIAGCPANTSWIRLTPA